jgi:hypothetical protein
MGEGNAVNEEIEGGAVDEMAIGTAALWTVTPFRVAFTKRYVVPALLPAVNVTTAPTVVFIVPSARFIDQA